MGSDVFHQLIVYFGAFEYYICINNTLRTFFCFLRKKKITVVALFLVEVLKELWVVKYSIFQSRWWHTIEFYKLSLLVGFKIMNGSVVYLNRFQNQ